MNDLISAYDAENELYTDEDLDWEQRQWNLEAEELNNCDEEGEPK